MPQPGTDFARIPPVQDARDTCQQKATGRGHQWPVARQERTRSHHQQGRRQENGTDGQSPIATDHLPNNVLLTRAHRVRRQVTTK